MTEPDALLAAVLADPANDLPRLMFADWCDDHGEPERAEFIRLQVSAARLPHGDPRRRSLADQAKQIFDPHRDAWKVSGVRGGQDFDRGFVSAWSVAADWFLAFADRMFAAAPVTTLRLRVMEAKLSRLVRVPVLGRVEHLDVSSNMLAAGNRLETLLTEAPFGRLRSLAVGNNRLFADELMQIVGSPVAPRLTALDLSGNPLADEGMLALADVTRLGRLERLTVRCNEQTFEDSVHADGVAALTRSAHLPRLTRLDLAGHRIGTGGVVTLLAGRLGRQVEELNLSNNDLGADEEGWASQLGADWWDGNLRRLRAGGRRNRIGEIDAEQLWTWLLRDPARSLDLRGAEVTPAARTQLASPAVSARVRIDPEAS